MIGLEKLVEANMEAFTRLYGEQGAEYMANTARMGKRVRFTLEPAQVNERFFAQERELYHLNGLFGPGIFYEQQVQIAAQVVDDIQSRGLPSNNRFGVLVELNVGHTNPAKRLERVAGIKKDKRKVSEDLRWQSLVDIIITHGASLISAHRINTGLNNVVSDLHDWIAERLYSGDEGETHPYRYNSYHDPMTNAVVAIGEQGKIAPPHLITREHFTRVRHAKRLGFVYTDPRVKGISATEKLIDQALLEYGVFRPEEVRDKGGIMYVTIGERPMRDKLKDRVVDLLEGHPLKAGDIIEEDEVGSNRGQSRKLEHRRVKFPIAIEGVEPIEFIFKALIDHRDQEDEIGQIDPNTGILTGQGHEPYEQRRSQRLLRAIYPKARYRDFDVEAAIREGSKELARDMMGRGVIEMKDSKNSSNGRVLSVDRVFVS